MADSHGERVPGSDRTAVNDTPVGTLVRDRDEPSDGVLLNTIRHEVALTPPRRRVGLAWKLGWTITGILFAVAAVLTTSLVYHAYEDALDQRDILADQGLRAIRLSACMSYLANQVDSASAQVFVSIVATLAAPPGSPERVTEFAHTQELAKSVETAVATREAAAVEVLKTGQIPSQCPAGIYTTPRPTVPTTTAETPPPGG